MATLITCDGCGATIVGEPERVGYVITREYCMPCTMRVGAYHAEVDQLHERLAAAWKDDLEAIRAKYRQTLAHLPDDNATVRIDADG